jgi:hypothetical protein
MKTGREIRREQKVRARRKTPTPDIYRSLWRGRDSSGRNCWESRGIDGEIRQLLIEGSRVESRTNSEQEDSPC